MPYGANIVEPIPVAIGNPVNSQTYAATGVAYDISIGSQPFFLLNDDNQPYRRVTAQYKKQQVDMSQEPGEQTLTSWWLRSQSSFHYGQGAKFYEPAQDQSLRFQYTYSKGCDVWTKGQVTLLNNVDKVHITTDPIASNGRPFQFARSIHWGTKQGILLHDGYDVDKIPNDGSGEVHFINYNAGVDKRVYAICDDGIYAYWITIINDAGVDKWAMYKKLLTDDYTVAGTLMWKDSTGVTSTPNVVLEYTKERIVGAINNKVYQWATNASALGTAVYTHPDTDVVFTSITSSGAAIYLSAYSGIQSNIYKFTLDTTGTMPTLTSAITAAEMPVGEKVFKIAYYLDYMAIGTSKGCRIAQVSSTDGSIAYGPLIFDSLQPVYDVCFRDKYLWCASGVADNPSVTTNINPGLTRINLGQQIGSNLIFAYAWDLYDPSITGYQTTACAFAGDSNQIIFTTNGLSAGLTVTYKQLTSNVAKLTTSANHGLKAGDSIWVEGVDSTFNSTTAPYTVIDTPTATTFTYAKVAANVALTAVSPVGYANIPGSIYVESATDKIPTGILHCGFVRFNTIENKLFKYLVPRFDTTNGSISILSVDQYQNEYNLGSYAQGSAIAQVGISYPVGAQQYLGFEFTFNRSGTDSTKGPTFTGYQVKVLPAVPRQRLIQFPVNCYDSVTDKFGNKAGYDGAAYDQVKALETIESNGDIIVVQDFRTNETFTGIIEEIDFINKTPTDKRYSGYGGTMLVTLRTMTGN